MERQSGMICIERIRMVRPAGWSGCGSSPTVFPSHRGGIIGRENGVTFESKLAISHTLEARSRAFSAPIPLCHQPPLCQSAFNGDPLSASEYDPPPGGWDRWGGVRVPLLLSEVETTAQPDLFYADHPRLPFHRCTTKRSFCNQTRWVKLDADFPPSGSSLQAFPHPRY